MRSNLQIKVGTYIGDGIDERVIGSVGCRGDLVIIKGGLNYPVFKTKEMLRDVSAYFSHATANLSGAIKEIVDDGFILGNNATVNANGTVYYYIVIKGVGRNYFYTGKYAGNAVNNRDFTTGGFNFTPDLVVIKSATTQRNVWLSSAMGNDEAEGFGADALTPNVIQNLQTNGFQLGTDASSNANTIDFVYWVMKKFKGIMSVGSFIGNGVNGRTIFNALFDGVVPDVAIVKKHVAGTYTTGRLKTSNMAINTDISLTNAGTATTGIKTLVAGGFVLGTTASANENNILYQYILLKNGNFNVPIIRASAS